MQILTNKMVGCCNIGPCKKKRTYEFNNPGYQSNKTDAGTYRQSQLFDEEGEETKVNGDAKLEGYASRSGDSLDGDSGHDPNAIKGVVAVELDSDNEGSPGRKDSKKGRKDSKRSSKKSTSSNKSSKRSSKNSDYGGERKAEPGVTSGETSVIRVSGTRSSAHDSEGGAERSSKASDTTEAGAVPYPDDNAENTTTTTTTYTSVITHRVDGANDDNNYDNDAIKRNSNISQSSSNRHVISSGYDPSNEGHFHSEHQYTVDLTPGKRTSTTSEADSRRMGQEDGSDVGSIVTERSSVLVNVPTEAEEFDNVANKLTEDLKNEDGEWHTVTETTETVIHINSPIEIGDNHGYSSSDFAM